MSENLLWCLLFKNVMFSEYVSVISRLCPHQQYTEMFTAFHLYLRMYDAIVVLRVHNDDKMGGDVDPPAERAR